VACFSYPRKKKINQITTTTVRSTVTPFDRNLPSMVSLNAKGRYIIPPLAISCSVT